MTSVDVAGGVAEFDRGLPRKRVSAGVLVTDAAGRVLLVDPVYKPGWEIPGGAVEAEESPRAGAVREVKEELGLVLPVGRLLVVDWSPARGERSESLAFVFDAGVLSPAAAGDIALPPDELRGFAFVEPAFLPARLTEVGARRMRAALAARDQDRTVYLEDGQPAG
jgi:ADP-ribose pyrophosphatase YjhB (NUDIX family)